jgi:ATP-dependent DNA helicase DinG
VRRCRRAAEDCFDGLLQTLIPRGEPPWRIADPFVVPDTLGDAMLSLAQKLRNAADGIFAEAERHDFHSLSDRLTVLAGSLRSWLEQNVPGSVWWVESHRSRLGRERLTLSIAPIDVGDTLRRTLFEKVGTVVLASATLAVGAAARRDDEPFEHPADESADPDPRDAAFAYLEKRLGLERLRDRVVSKRLGSAFDYQTQAKLVLLDGLPPAVSRLFSTPSLAVFSFLSSISAILRRMLRLASALPFRIRQWSSWNVTSNCQCRSFSIAQWPLTMAANFLTGIFLVMM